MSTTDGANGRLSGLPPIDPRSGLVTAVIDTPRNSRCKYRYAADLGLFRLGKLLPLGSSFPYDFGFVPSTAAEDGDPLDVLVILNEPVAIGCVVSLRVLGVLKAEQTERDGKTIENDRLIGVVETEFNPPEFRSLGDLGDQRLREIEHFFHSYNEMEGKQFRSLGYGDADEAVRLIDRARIQPAGEPSNSSSDSDGNGQTAGADSDERDGARHRRGKGFRLTAQESAGKGLRRIVRKQTERALQELERARTGEEGRVHDLRKRFKKLRAALRLVRNDLKERQYRKQNSALRNAAHTLNDVRDARVLLESWKGLSEKGAREIADKTVSGFHEMLEDRSRQALRGFLSSPKTFDAVGEALESAQAASQRWQLDASDWKDFRGGIERVYSDCCRAFRAATVEQTTANLHEWRKQVKYLWYCLQILESVWAEGMARWGESTHRLSTLLGDDHDLEMLQAALSEAAPRLKDDHGAASVLRVIDGDRERLQAQAMSMGGQVFHDPAAMTQCIGAAN